MSYNRDIKIGVYDMFVNYSTCEGEIQLNEVECHNKPLAWFTDDQLSEFPTDQEIIEFIEDETKECGYV